MLQAVAMLNIEYTKACLAERRNEGSYRSTSAGSPPTNLEFGPGVYNRYGTNMIDKRHNDMLSPRRSAMYQLPWGEEDVS